jgi:UDP-N-acetylmuramate dehydrogenase
MNPSDKAWLSDHFVSNVSFDEPMRRHTTFRIGGPADALVAVRSEKEIAALVLWAHGRGHSVTILGAGSNLLVRDGGVRGVTVRLADDFEAIRQLPGDNGTSVVLEAGAAVQVHRLSKYALDNSLDGLNFAIGIPGTVGGTLRMNAGAWGMCMADSTGSIRILNRQGEISSLERDQLRFSYRKLDLEEGAIILSGRFKMKHGDQETLQKEAIRMQKRRRATQPLSMPSAGSVFRNPDGERAAGELIDMAGLKGLRVGEAEISSRHANFIINTGNARASDVLNLMKQVQETVSERFGVDLEPEVTVVGQETGS